MLMAEMKNKELQRNTDFGSCIEKDIQCSVCSFYFKTLEDYQGHVESLEHAQKLITKLNGQSKVQFSEKQSENIDYKKMIIDDSCYKNSFLNTDKSLNVAEEVVNEETVIEDSQLDKTVVKTNESFSNCSICKKEFTGLEPYKQHMESNIHKKKVNIFSKNGAVGLSSQNNMLLNSEKPHKIAENSMEIEENSSIVNKNEKIIELIEDSRLVKIQTKMKETYFSLCTICNKTFSGPEPYRQHIESIGHTKKMNLFSENGAVVLSSHNNMSLNTEKTHRMPEESMEVEENLIDSKNVFKENLSTMSENDEKSIKRIGKINESNFSRCCLCDKTFSGPEPYRQHMESIGHKKKVKNSTTISFSACKNSILNCNKLHNMDEVIMETEENLVDGKKFSQNSSLLNETTKNITEDSQVKIQVKMKEPYFSKCVICAKTFTGPEPYQEHMVSIGHKKKSFLQGNNGKKEALNDKETSVCDVIQESYSPEIIHKGSSQVKITEEELHQKESEEAFSQCRALQQDFAGTDNVKKTLVSNNQFGMHLSCSTCNKEFTGPIPFDQHLKSELHLKKKRSEYLLRKCNVPNNESFNQYEVSSADSTSEKTGSNLMDSKHKSISPWYCIPCKIPSSDPIPFNDHLKGVIHKENMRKVNFEAKCASMETLPDSSLDETDFCENNASDNNLRHSSDNILELSQNDSNLGISAEQLNCTIFSVDSKINFDIRIKK